MTKLPPLADVAHLDDPEFYARAPHDVFARLRAEAPVFWCEGTKFWAVNRYEHVRHVLRHPELFSSRDDQQLESWANHREQLFRFGEEPYPPDHALNLITVDKPLHTSYRKMVLRTGMFGTKATPAIEANLRPIIATRLAEVRDLEGEADDVLSAPIAAAAVGEHLGLSSEYRDKIREWAETVEPPEGVDSGDARTHAAEAMKEMWNTLIDQMRSGAREDRAVCLLRDAHAEDQAVDFDSLIAFICDLIVAGVEALRTTITGSMVALAEHPDEWDRVVADVELVPNVVEELFRWVSPASSMGRVACADSELGGQHIRTGDRVLMMFISANRDEEVFERANRFDAGREFRPGHLAFGLGMHLCLGAELSRTVLRVLLEEMRNAGVRPVLRGEPKRSPGYNAMSQFASVPLAFEPAAHDS